MYTDFQKYLEAELQGIRDAGLYKEERVITSAQQAAIKVAPGKDVLNFCANNYLGLANSQALVDAAKAALDTHGYGMSSVRFICGTGDLHKELEKKISEFFGTEDAILYASCFDANGGVFEPLLDEHDAIISDALNHASIIDGVRLCKAQRYRYANANMEELENCLKMAQAQRHRIIVTDGVFSMDGNVAPLDKIHALAEKYNAMVMVDESHSAGVVGRTGRGTTERFNLRGQIEILTGTLGKSFGGAVGGFTTGKKEIIAMLRQRSRPYLFSNSIPPMIAAAGIKMFEMMSQTNELQDKLHAKHRLFHRQDEGRRLRHQAHRIGHLRRDALRRPALAEDGGPSPGRGHLRHRLLLSRRPEGPGPHPRPGFRRTREGAPRQMYRSLYQDR